MKRCLVTGLFALGSALGGVSAAFADPIRLMGTPCSTPAVMHCPDADCARDIITNRGPAVDPKTGRSFFLDYPCDLKKGDKVTLILSLHGAGSIGNWQRHYFPLLDYKDKYRLVIATPTAATDQPTGSVTRFGARRQDPKAVIRRTFVGP